MLNKKKKLLTKELKMKNGNLSKPQTGPAFSHFFFAYDIILTASVSLASAYSIKMSLDTFYNLLGLKVS